MNLLYLAIAEFKIINYLCVILYCIIEIHMSHILMTQGVLFGLYYV